MNEQIEELVVVNEVKKEINIYEGISIFNKYLKEGFKFEFRQVNSAGLEFYKLNVCDENGNAIFNLMTFEFTRSKVSCGMWEYAGIPHHRVVTELNDNYLKETEDTMIIIEEIYLYLFENFKRIKRCCMILVSNIEFYSEEAFNCNKVFDKISNINTGEYVKNPNSTNNIRVWIC